MNLLELGASKILSNLMLLEGRIRWMCKRNHVVLPNGTRMYFAPKDRIQVYGYVTTVWKYNVYGDVDGGTIMDVGSNIGAYTLKVVDVAEQVIAIEPVPRFYQLLLQNLLMNRIKSVVPLNIALGHYDGVTDMHLTRQMFGEGHEINPLHSSKDMFSVHILTLDTLLKDFSHISAIDMVKVDIEGYEEQMLLGAQKTLEKGVIQQFAIAVYHFKDEPERVEDILHQYGYDTRSKFFWDGDIILYGRLKQ